MTKLLGFVLTITRTFIVVSAVVMAAALTMWSGLAGADDRIIHGEGGGDTSVIHTYDDKTKKLLMVKRSSEIDDPNDRTKITKKLEIKRYDQGKRPPYETSVEEQEIVLVERNGQRNRVVRKRTMVTTTYTKTGEREPVAEVKEVKELVALDANGVPIYTGSRFTAKAKGVTPGTNEVWDARTGNWQKLPGGSTVDDVLEAQKQKLLEAQKLIRLSHSKTAKINQQQPAGEPTGEAPDKGPHYLVNDRTEIIKKDTVKREEQHKVRLEDDKPAQKPAPKPICHGEPDGEWRGGTLARVKQMATDWRRELSAPCFNDHPGACRQIRGRISFDAYMKTLMIWQCHATFVKQRHKNRNEDRVTARKEGCAIKKTLDQMAEQIKATRFMKAGAGWKPFHVNMHKKWGLKDLCEPEKIEEASSGSAKEPKPVAEANPKTKKECTGGGLVGAMNCVTKRIEGAGGTGAKTPGRVPTSASSTDKNTGETTTSVKNPDGTRTITKTDKDGNVLSTKTVGKGPASASSTDRKTGITTKSVRNPDGTRTVTKTDKDGNILSRERTGKVPDIASSTETKSLKTTTSVANPDGSRTVTTTDKDGNVLSRERVR